MPLQYTAEISVSLPRDQVVAIFEDPEQASHWMEGLQSMTPISGEPGAVDSVTELDFLMGKRRMVMKEMITANDLPETFSCRYDADGVRNFIDNRFIAVSENETRWEMDNVFEFEGFMMKIMGALMPFMFKKQTMTYAQNFKAWAEDGKSVMQKS
jgi:carbon monoxide dehydrogenase subunit G